MVGRVVNDRYRVLALLAGQETVAEYAAIDLETGAPVSINLLSESISKDSEFARRLVSDIELSSRVEHRHIEQVFELGEIEGQFYVVTEYVVGTRLDLLLEAGVSMTAPQVIKLGYELCDGLLALHSEGIIHADVSPRNVIVSNEGVPKLSNGFLINALLEAERGRLDSVGMGVEQRPPHFLAPETLNGSSSQAADIYSLAVTLHEALGRSLETTAREDNSSEVTRIKQVKVASEFGAAVEVLNRAIAIEPDFRCGAIEMKEGLAKAAKHFVAPQAIRIPESLLQNDLIGVHSQVDPVRLELDMQPLRWRPVWKLGASMFLFLMLFVAAAAWAVSSVQPQGISSHLVEEYVGRTIGEVRGKADSMNWILDEDQIRSDDLPPGIVMAQRPSSGRRLSEGSILVVEVSSGPRLRITPVVVGLSSDDAMRRMEAKGFSVDSIQPVYDESVAKDEVMKVLIEGEEVLGGRLREPGSKATLIVSGGPVPRTVPQLVGMSQESAAAALQATQLEIAVPPIREFSEVIEEGIVIGQSVSPGRLVERGSSVLLTISLGSDRQEVPELGGLSVVEAQRKLSELGFLASTVFGEGSEVQSTDPPAGTLIPRGSTVDLKLLTN